MHHIYIHTRRDPEKTWVVSHFQINKAEVKTTMTEWEEEWKQDVPPGELSESEDEEENSADKKAK